MQGRGSGARTSSRVSRARDVCDTLYPVGSLSGLCSVASPQPPFCPARKTLGAQAQRNYASVRQQLVAEARGVQQPSSFSSAAVGGRLHLCRNVSSYVSSSGDLEPIATQVAREVLWRHAADSRSLQLVSQCPRRRAMSGRRYLHRSAGHINWKSTKSLFPG